MYTSVTRPDAGTPRWLVYIFTERNGIYIIDLQKTVKKLDDAYMFVRELCCRTAENVLFVGTKKQAGDSVKEEAERAGRLLCKRKMAGRYAHQLQDHPPQNRPSGSAAARWKRTAPLIVCPRRKLVKLELEIEKLEKFLGGIKEMNKLPGCSVHR